MGAGMYANTGSGANATITFLSWISPLHYTCTLLLYRAYDGKNELITQEILTNMGFDKSVKFCYCYLLGFVVLVTLLGWIFIVRSVKN